METYNGKAVNNVFNAKTIQIGDYVNADVVTDLMDCLPPACMRLNCAQVGEPYSHREDPDTKRWRATYATFKCIQGGWSNGVWEYCGNCFYGEIVERGKDPVYV